VADEEPTEPVEPAVSGEALQVFHWRREHFIELGFTIRQATCLAERMVTWHDAETLVDDGCPIAVCFDILS
jgi:hypothetical protein